MSSPTIGNQGSVVRTDYPQINAVDSNVSGASIAQTTPHTAKDIGEPASPEKQQKAKENFATRALNRHVQAGDAFVASLVTAVPRFLGALALTFLASPIAAVGGAVMACVEFCMKKADNNSGVINSDSTRNVEQIREKLFNFAKLGVINGTSSILFTPVDLLMSSIRFLTAWAVSKEVSLVEMVTKDNATKSTPSSIDVMQHVHEVVTSAVRFPEYILFKYKAKHAIETNQKESLRGDRAANPLKDRFIKILGHTHSILTQGNLKQDVRTANNDGYNKFVNLNYQKTKAVFLRWNSNAYGSSKSAVKTIESNNLT